MRFFNTRWVIATLFGLLAASQLLAQGTPQPRGMGGWGPRTPYARMYDPQSVATLTGEVVSVDKFAPAKGMSYGVHAVIKTDQETLPVHLGPAWYIDNQDLQIAPGDKIEVKGSRISFEGKPALIAAEVKKGDDVLVLRDGSGFPAWSGWKRR